MKVVDIEKLYNFHVLAKTQFCRFHGQKPRGTCPGRARVLGTLGTGFGKNRGHWSLILQNCPRCPLGKTLLKNFHVLSFPCFGL